MSVFWSVVTSLLYAAAFVACLLWANWAYRQLDLGQRFNLPVGVRLLIVLAAGGLVYSPISRILGGIFDAFRKYGNGWYNAAAVVGVLLMLAGVGWLYMRANLENVQSS
jgi:hypothetical protein